LGCVGRILGWLGWPGCDMIYTQCSIINKYSLQGSLIYSQVTFYITVSRRSMNIPDPIMSINPAHARQVCIVAKLSHSRTDPGHFHHTNNPSVDGIEAGTNLKLTCTVCPQTRPVFVSKKATEVIHHPSPTDTASEGKCKNKDHLHPSCSVTPLHCTSNRHVRKSSVFHIRS
jgi:hypothetical protein